MDRAVEIYNARDEVEIRRYGDRKECDVVVTVRGREMVLKLPSYSQAITWAQMEAKSYGITAEFREEQVG
jgi:hypothetical protein